MNTTSSQTRLKAGASPARGPGTDRVATAIRPSPRLLAALLTISLLVQPREVQSAAPASKLPLYELKMDPKDLADLDRNPGSAKTHPATFLAGGKEYTVAVRYRGDWARTWPKKPLKIFFEKDNEFEGRRCLNLNSEWRDPAFIREPMAYHIYAACGVPASACRMVRLQLNGRFYGLYADVEQPDKPLLKRYGLKGASIYKADSHSWRSDERDLGGEKNYASHYKKETRTSEGQRDLQLFCHDLAGATDVAAFFTNRVDVERYINYLAATALTQHWDCFSKNHFLLHDDAGSGKWLVVPWDLDRTLGDHWHGPFDEAQLPLLLGMSPLPGPTGWNRMEDRFLNDRTLRARFLNRLEELLQKEFTKEKLFPVLDRLEDEISPEAALDRQRWPAPAADFHNGIAGVRSYIERRRAFLLHEIARLRRE